MLIFLESYLAEHEEVVEVEGKGSADQGVTDRAVEVLQRLWPELSAGVMPQSGDVVTSQV